MAILHFPSACPDSPKTMLYLPSECPASTSPTAMFINLYSSEINVSSVGLSLVDAFSKGLSKVSSKAELVKSFDSSYPFILYDLSLFTI